MSSSSDYDWDVSPYERARYFFAVPLPIAHSDIYAA